MLSLELIPKTRQSSRLADLTCMAEIRSDRGFDVWCGVAVRPCNIEKRSKLNGENRDGVTFGVHSIQDLQY